MAQSTPTDYAKLKLSNPQFGEVEFAGFEVPGALQFGGEQRTIVMQFVGNNKREVQTLGTQPRPISWKGAFYYETAIKRARFLDQLRHNGDVLNLTWGDFKYQVVIEHFNFDPTNQHEIPYEITLQVVSEESVRASLVASSDWALREDRSMILKILEVITTLVTAIRRVQSVISAVRKGDVSAIFAAAGSLSGTMGSISNQLGVASTAQLSSMLSQANLIVMSSRNYIDQVSGQIDITHPLDDMHRVEANAILLQELLRRQLEPAQSSSVTVLNANLFDLANKYYGTIDAWEVIAKANGLNGAVVTGETKLKLPPYKGQQPKSLKDSTVYEVPTVALPAP